MIYQVVVTEKVEAQIEVEANSPAQAREKAENGEENARDDFDREVVVVHSVTAGERW